MAEGRFSTPYNLRSSLDKQFNILANIALEPFSVAYAQGPKISGFIYTPPDDIIISDKLFREYDCLDHNCSRCCWKTRHWNIFTPQQYDAMPQEKKRKAQSLPVVVNENSYTFQVEDNTVDSCQHVEHNACAIHEYNPLHCALPLIKFKRTKRGDKEVTYVTREVYTRNWHMQCPVELQPITQAGKEKTLWIFDKVKSTAEELGIQTAIDDLILAVEDRKI